MRDYKETKRLTQWTTNGASLILDSPQNDQEAREQLMAKFKLACNKLAELEDAIESDELVSLPCKVGDTIYVITQGVKQPHILTEKVTHAEFEYDDGLLEGGVYTSGLGISELDNFYKLRKLGTVWFTDKAQAEAKLKELEGK